VRHAFAGVPEGEARQILGLNAIKCFGLDQDHLAAVADKIGIVPSELLGAHEVDSRILTSFHDRSGYQRPQEVVDPDFYGRMLVSDIEAVETRR
jgi:hypothetical protein